MYQWRTPKSWMAAVRTAGFVSAKPFLMHSKAGLGCSPPNPKSLMPSDAQFKASAFTTGDFCPKAVSRTEPNTKLKLDASAARLSASLQDSQFFLSPSFSTKSGIRQSHTCCVKDALLKMVLMAVNFAPSTWKLLSLRPGFLQIRTAVSRVGIMSIPDNLELTSSRAASLAFQLASPSSFKVASVITSPHLPSASSRAISGSMPTPPPTVDFALAAPPLPALLGLAPPAFAPPDFTTLAPAEAGFGLAAGAPAGAGFSLGFTTLGPGFATSAATFLGLGAELLPVRTTASAFSLILSSFNLSKSGMKGVTLFSPRNLKSAPSASAEASLTSPSDS